MGFAGGRGFSGRGFGGGGHGWRHWFYATGTPRWLRFGTHPEVYPKPDPEMEKRALKNEAEALQTELDSVKRRLSELEAAAQ